jgi:HTH-type transcriptional repressor of NAD biosynthesis genes
MKRGLVLGKFMPLHAGHVRLVEFAAARCDELIVLVCATEKEPIPGAIRRDWVEETFGDHKNIKPQLLWYDDRVLPNTSESSSAVSRIWADHLHPILPKIDVFFSSEKYGDYVAEFLNCAHIAYDLPRQLTNISATQILQNPFQHWDFLPPAVRPYFVKKICLYGTESTGKTTLTQKLAAHFHTTWVPEMARDIIEGTEDCTEEHLRQIAELHATTIQKKIKTANKLLFVDTDLNITRGYSQYLFGKEMIVPEWIEQANHFDLHLFLEADAPFVQDGTRLKMPERNHLQEFHRAELVKRGIAYTVITGDWEERFTKAGQIVVATFLRN